MSYSDAVRYLYDLQARGMKFGLEGISSLLHAMQHPQHGFPSIHIAGTNGKGSTASMLAAVFTAGGYKTGLYTSPHLIDFTERIRINGRPISKKDVVQLTSELRRQIEKQQATFFEATTAMAFVHFARKKVDVAIIEAGLGGRLDATNVLRPLISVITNVGLEHTEILGNTLEKIAAEKAGIVKKGIPCITGVTDPGALRVIRSVCESKSAPFIRIPNFRVRISKASIEGTILDLNLAKAEFKNLRLSLPGEHQIRNAALALGVIKQINKGGDFQLGEAAIHEGLAHVQALTGLEGRMGLVHRNPTILLDVAHNPDAAKTLASALRQLGLEDLVLVFGVMKDKELKPMVGRLVPQVGEVIAVSAKTDRARSASDIAVAFDRRGVKVTAALSVREGVGLAVQRASRQTTILVTGSHVVVGEAMEALRLKKMLDNH